MPDIEPFYLFTSISPKLGPEALKHHRSCVASWRAAGFEVVTVNGQSEVARVGAFELDVEIVAAGYAGKPSIADILASVRAKGSRYAGIINADCLLLPYPELPRHLAGVLDGTVFIVERLDVDADFVPQSDTCSGFDAFFFDTAVLPAEIDGEFRIGVPWWDYSFPMIAARSGARIINIETPLITHRLHQQGWGDEDLMHVGQKLWQILRDWRASDRSSFPAMGEKLESLLSEVALTRDQLQIVGLACFRWLRGRRAEPPQRFLDYDMRSIEMLLRKIRVALNEKAAELGRLQEELGRAKDASARMQRSLEDRIAILDYKTASLKADLAEKDKHLDAIHTSLSWRLTRPLRSVVEIIRPAPTVKG